MKSSQRIAVACLAWVAAFGCSSKDKKSEAPADGPGTATTQPAPAARTVVPVSTELRPIRPPRFRRTTEAGRRRITGVVRTHDGAPVSGATVGVRGTAVTTKSDENGGFELVGLRARTYELFAQKDAALARQWVGAATESVSLVQTDAHALTLRVVDAVTGRPVRARVATDPGGRNATSARGELTVPARGWIEYRVEANGRVPETGHVYVAKDRAIRVGLRSGRRVTGRVWGLRRQPLANADIAVLQGTAGTPVATNEQGQFAVTIPQGGGRLRVSHSAYTERETESVLYEQDPVIHLDERAAKINGVVTQSGQPVADARVRAWSHGVVHEVWSGADGRFVLGGLERGEIVVGASHGDALSAAQTVDLSAKRVVDLEIPIAKGDKIEGRVDGDGPQVVSALPDPQAGGRGADVVLAPPAAAVDAEGRFVLGPVAKGTTLRVVRAGPDAAVGWRSLGVSHAGGALSLRADAGRLTGRVMIDGKRAPRSFRLWVGDVPFHPVDDGTFAVEQVPAGEYDLTIEGPGFAAYHAQGVRILAGESTDLGTIQLSQGRRISGTIKNKKNEGIANATVWLAPFLVGDSTFAGSPSVRARRVLTDKRGRFSFAHASPTPQVLVAEHPNVGRTVSQMVPAGKAALKEEIKMFEIGNLRGRVLRGGKPIRNAFVLLSPVVAPSHVFSMPVRSNGRFRLDVLTPGDYDVSVVERSERFGDAVLATRQVPVQSLGNTRAEFELEPGGLRLVVTVAAKEGQRVDFAKVFLAEGTLRAEHAGMLEDLVSSGERKARVSYAAPGRPALISGLSKGAYSVCVAPITGDLEDPVFAKMLSERRRELDVHCQMTRVAAGAETQHVALTVPAMRPFSESKK